MAVNSFRDKKLEQALLSALASMPMLAPVGCCCAGILIGGGHWVAAAVAAAVSAAVMVAYGRIQISHKSNYRVFALVAFAIGLVGALMQHTPAAPDEVFDGRRHIYYGTVEQSSEIGSGQTLTVAIDSCDGEAMPRFKARLVLQFAEPQISSGADLRFSAVLEPITIVKDVDDERDPAEWLLSRGITAQSFLNTPSGVTMVSAPSTSFISGMFGQVRLWVCRTIEQAPLSPDVEAMLKAFLAGDRSDITPELNEAFSAAGAAHMLAISGAHVGIVAMLVGLLLFPLSVWTGRRTVLVATVVVVWMFVMVCGAPASAVRAAVMLSVPAAARLLQRMSPTANSLLIAAFLILAVDPGQLLSLGFQLSFVSVACILAFSNLLNPFDRRHAVLRFFAGMLSVSFAATLGCGLICMYHFHTFPLYFLITNMVVGLLAPWFIAAGLLALLCSALSLPCAAVWWIADAAGRLMDVVVTDVAAVPGATLRGIYLPSLTFLPYFAMLVMLWCAIKAERARRICVSALIVLGCVAGAVVWAYRPEARSEWFVCRSTSPTAIIVNDGSRLGVFTSDGRTSPELMERIEARFGIYMERRGLAGPVCLPGDTSRRLGQRVCRGTIVLGSDTLFLAANGTRQSDLPRRINYLVFGRGVKQKWSEIYGVVCADTVISFTDGEEFVTMPHHSLQRGRWLRSARGID